MLKPFFRRSLPQAALALGGLFVLTGAGCQSGASAGASNAGTTTGGATTPAVTTPPATTPAAPATPAASAFDADRAYSDLKKQCAFGPRVPNTPGHTEARDWILAQLKASTDKASLQSFTQDLGDVTISMSNIVGEINPDAAKKVMLCAHWDTRPTADQEIDAARKKQPIPGANDGASGVAVLLELARMFHAKRPDVGVQIVLFDGEDYGPGIERMFLGARHYAKKPALPKPTYAILIDMIGDKDLQIYRERNSEDQAPAVNDKVWQAAKALNVPAFKDRVNYEIQDDHLSLQEAGWKAIDLIDFDYAPWHTLDDTPEQCAPASLKAVGDVLARVVYSEKP